ncbi:hypothetical protein [Immundisolibacter cernigliae]|uniref:hypothetical protein n=1 Tax=Immundisolibacter cernigliae TaxID=1810504 RepID=UPI0011AB3536|nr:hypothetical protein [Immundisolibacter cernigliae]
MFLVMLLGVMPASTWAAAEMEALRVTPLFASEADTIAALKPLSAMGKDRFESTADFVKKLCPATEKAMNVKVGESINLVAFWGAVGLYDADKRVFEFDLLSAVLGLFDRSLDKFLGIKIAMVERKMGSFQAENTFGVSKDVSVIEREEVILLLPTNLAHPISWKKNIQLSARPEEARKLHNDMQFVVTTKLQRPCFVTGRFHRSPDFLYPVKENTTLLGVFVSRDSSWKIIKKSTGEVLKMGGF